MNVSMVTKYITCKTEILLRTRDLLFIYATGCTRTNILYGYELQSILFQCYQGNKKQKQEHILFTTTFLNNAIIF